MRFDRLKMPLPRGRGSARTARTRRRIYVWQAAAVTFGLLVLGPVVAARASDSTAPHGEAGTAVDRVGVTNAAPAGGPLEAVLFYVVAGGAVAAAIGVCAARNIVRMAVWLFLALGSVAMLYFLLAANFLGAIQFIVYVGGVLVLLIFGVMLTTKSPWVRFDVPKRELFAAGLVCITLLAALCVVLVGTTWNSAEGVVPGAAVADLGKQLLTTYLVVFEVAGVLLMVVMVGAAHLARPGD